MRSETSVAVTSLLVLLTAGGVRAEGPTIVVVSKTVLADDLSFEVRLDTDTDVAGVQSDIVFDPPTLVARRDNGKPKCVVNRDIEKHGTAFAFFPIGCTPGVSCTTVRSLVLSLETVDPIRERQLSLYSCALAADTPPGHYALHCDNPGAANPEGAELPATCVDGEIEVGREHGAARGQRLRAARRHVADQRQRLLDRRRDEHQPPISRSRRCPFAA